MAKSARDAMARPARGATPLRGGQVPTDLVGRIYDAVLQPESWSEVLAAVGAFVGGQAGGILSKDSISKAGTPHHHFGVAPAYVQSYATTHSRSDPVATLPLFEVGQIVSIPELVPHDEYLQGRFFLEWMRPQGWLDAANAMLEKSDSGCSLITIIRSAERGFVDDEMRRRMALIVPHLRRAVVIGNVIDRKRAETASFADLLDGLSASLFLIAADGRVVHANAAGRAMIGVGDVLRSTGGRLVSRDRQADKVLRDTFAAAGHGDIGVGSGSIALALRSEDGEHYVAHVLPMTAGARRSAGIAYAATAAVFVRKAAMEAPSAPELVARIYNLTPTELRVLLAVVDVGGIPEIAVALGVAESTIKTHVGRLFEKTGTSRQADLVKLVAGFSMPLAA